jgi:hypothetical protein
VTKQQTIERQRSGTNVDVLSIFAEHYKLASCYMKPEAALHTAYTAAANYLAQHATDEVKEQA